MDLLDTYSMFGGSCKEREKGKERERKGELFYYLALEMLLEKCVGIFYVEGYNWFEQK